jgi:hypothetical protein
LGSRTDSGRTNNGGLSNVRPQNFDSTILVDDVSSGCYSCCVFERGSTRYRNTELCCRLVVFKCTDRDLQGPWSTYIVQLSPFWGFSAVIMLSCLGCLSRTSYDLGIVIIFK